MNLSKSLYTKGIQCQKLLWLKKYKPSVLTPPNAAALAVFETGNVVGDLACELFPDGKEIAFSRDYDSMMAQTQEYLDSGVRYIYEATFAYDGILVMVDVLEVKADGVCIYEVKSSTSVKDIYLHDVSIQSYVLQKLGFNVSHSYVVHINNTYVRDEALSLEELFSVVDVTEEASPLVDGVPRVLAEFEESLSDKEREPDIDIGKHCNKPYECDAKDYCFKVQRDIPDYSVFNIFNLGSKKQLELYEMGIVNIQDIPEDFTMTQKQAQAVQNYKSNAVHIEKKAIAAFVDTLTYPIYHLDFETFQQAVPQFKGIKPFMQIPFQYSLHIEHEDGTLEHKEFLAEDGIDPREVLVRRLCEDIPTNVTVLAYNMSFEKGVIEKLALRYPALSETLLGISANIKDLMVPFAKKSYVTPSMNGSYSIKYVLPALVPAMSDAYAELDGVQNGSDAMSAYATMSKLEAQEKKKLRESLLAYCKLDTLAMVEVLKKLREVSE
ncbi:DUF2779 domain-containing protein [Sulfurimonas sp.]|jgi:hypothetical protein|uniref:DUF2779 domain-containing protein n=1 Tax=Sulfurimonas sp. TaxID=2022749 RepID=UPI0025D2DF20|nr:DUF2779 domain-containing protein [Sulfurimonas sp.]MBT5934387.1 DUF2779 domain-containing protein [Sulfurimonas sp.]